MEENKTSKTKSVLYKILAVVVLLIILVLVVAFIAFILCCGGIIGSIIYANFGIGGVLVACTVLLLILHD